MDGADPEAVRSALETRAPLSGIDGFAGELDGRLVRDALGRYPLFSAAEDPTHWSFDPTDLLSPDPVPAGHVRDGNGDQRVWTLPTPEPFDDDNRAIETVRAAVTAAVDAIEKAPPIAFSGGLDSSILAARLDGPLYVGGF
ncbi:MAG: asparagine synthetase B, partial [Natronomonas sp.]